MNTKCENGILLYLVDLVILMIPGQGSICRHWIFSKKLQIMHRPSANLFQREQALQGCPDSMRRPNFRVLNHPGSLPLREDDLSDISDSEIFKGTKIAWTRIKWTNMNVTSSLEIFILSEKLSQLVLYGFDDRAEDRIKQLSTASESSRSLAAIFRCLKTISNAVQSNVS